MNYRSGLFIRSLISLWTFIQLQHLIAQSFAPFNADSRKLFFGEGDGGLAHSMAFDSVVVSADTVKYYNFRFVNGQDTIPCELISPTCHSLTRPSWLGSSIEVVGSGHVFHTNEGATLNIPFHLEVGEAELMYSDADQQFLLIYEGQMDGEVLGMPETLRRWVIQHQDPQGQTIASALNGATIDVGETIGLVNFIQVDSFPLVLRPLTLAGQIDPPLGVHTITPAIAMDLHPGDELQFITTQSNASPSQNHWVIQQRQDLGDAVELLIARTRISDGVIFQDTVWESYSRTEVIAEIPFERIHSGRVPQFRKQNYCGLELWTHVWPIAPTIAYSSACSCSYYGSFSTQNGHYTRVLGLGLYSSSLYSAGMGGFSATHSTISFIKDGVDCGTPIITGLSEGKGDHMAFTISPNPAIDRFKVNGPAGRYTWELLSYTGTRVSSGQGTGTEWVIGTEGLSAGMYILRIHSAAGQVAGRLVVIMDE